MRSARQQLRHLGIGLFIVALALTVLPAGLTKAAVYPGATWQTATPPETMGMSSAQLKEARDYALQGGGAGMIIRSGKVVMSWGNIETRYDLKSTTKSMAGATALGLAIKDGKVSLSGKAQSYYADFGKNPSSNVSTGWLDDITIKHLATHTAGFDKPGGYISLLYQPGSAWAYSDGGTNWLADVLTVRYRQDLKTLLFNRVFSKIGITSSDLTWRSNAYRETTLNGVARREFGAGISANADAMARLGYLYLRRGTWNTTSILPSSYIDQVRQPQTGVTGLPVKNDTSSIYQNASNHYGLLWWNNGDGAMVGVPTDTYFSWGLFDSLIVVIPSLDIVAVRAGNTLPGTRSPDQYVIFKKFILPIAQSVTD